MITKYTIKIKDNEEILYLYLQYDYEFANELGNIKNKIGIIDRVKEYINKMKIKFKGKYIVLVVAGIATITLACSSVDLNQQDEFVYVPNILEISEYKTSQENKPNLEIEKPPVIEESKEVEENDKVTNQNEEIKENNQGNNQNQTEKKPNVPKPDETLVQKPNNQTTPKPNVSDTNNQTNIKPEITKPNKEETMVTIYRSSGIVETIELEEYLVGVVAAEMPASFNNEALKAQAVVARTYTLKKIEENKILTDTTATQVYKDNNQLKTMWGNNYSTYYNKIKNAVNVTEGLIVTYNNKPIDAVFHSTSNGYTVDAEDVWGNDIPYLKSVSSSFDKNATSYLRETTKEIADIEKLLGIKIDENSIIEILEKDKNGRVIKVSIDGFLYTGLELRSKLGLRSTDFDILVDGKEIIFATKGYGHGVGMSQYGANGMANSGYTYREIINHYYTNVKIIEIE